MYIQILVYFRHIASSPELHQAMHLVDERRGRRSGGIIAQAGALVLVPLLQLHGAARPFFSPPFAPLTDLGLIFLNAFFSGSLTTFAGQQVLPRDQTGSFECTGNSTAC